MCIRDRYETAPYFYGTGRRKSSVARVRIYQGTGKVTSNDRDIDDYFGLDTLKYIAVSYTHLLLRVKGKFLQSATGEGFALPTVETAFLFTAGFDFAVTPGRVRLQMCIRDRKYPIP